MNKRLKVVQVTKLTRNVTHTAQIRDVKVAVAMTTYVNANIESKSMP